MPTDPFSVTFHHRGHGNSTKFWFMPDGQLHDTDGAYHYLWGQRHLSFLQSQYSITLDDALAKSTEEQPVRIALIQQKMVRVHHCGRRNLLTVEGTWQGLSEAVLQALQTLIISHPDDITSVCVNCFNQPADRYYSASANFVGCQTPETRTAKIDQLLQSIDSKTNTSKIPGNSFNPPSKDSKIAYERTTTPARASPRSAGGPLLSEQEGNLIGNYF